jgi:hypothetical protein
MLNNPRGVILDRITSQQMSGVANGATQSTATGIINQTKKE